MLVLIYYLLFGYASCLFNSSLIAPYYYIGAPSDIQGLATAANTFGLKAVTVAFLIGDSSSASQITGMASDIQGFMATGGWVILSLGGQSGPYLESANDATALFNIVDGVLQSTGIRAIDFDIEGQFLNDDNIKSKRQSLISALRTKYGSSLYVSYTLPVNQNGLESGSLSAVTSAVAAGISLNVINIMTMDYGAGSNVAQLTVSSVSGLYSQLKTIYPAKSSAEIYSMIGVTVMIGENDDYTTFSLDDAVSISKFAASNSIGLLSYWSINRDRPGCGGLNTYSQNNKNENDYFVAFTTQVAPPGRSISCKAIFIMEIVIPLGLLIIIVALYYVRRRNRILKAQQRHTL